MKAAGNKIEPDEILTETTTIGLMIPDGSLLLRHSFVALNASGCSGHWRVGSLNSEGLAHDGFQG